MDLSPEYVYSGREAPLFTTEGLTGRLREIRDEAADTAPALAHALRQDARAPNLSPSRICNTCDCPDPRHDLPERPILTRPRLPLGLHRGNHQGRVLNDK